MYILGDFGHILDFLLSFSDWELEEENKLEFQF